MNDPSPEQRKRNRQFLLRAFVLLSAVVGTVFYAGIWIWLFQISSNRRDGFELIAPFVGTIYFVLFVVPCWYFGVRNYGLGLASAFAAIGSFIAIYQGYNSYPWFIY